MLLGIDALGLVTFARTISTDKPPVDPLKHWVELCKEDTTWTEIEKQEVDIERCPNAN